MELLALTSDNPNFRSITFKKGLNIVVGTQLTKEQKKSINGIGKSLSLSLIHHIFGASFRSSQEKKLKSFLETYGSFTLEFRHNNIDYKIIKDFSKSSYEINGETITHTNYPKELNKIFLNDATHKPSFKQILNCFARRYSDGATYYSNCLTQQGRPVENYDQKYTNLFLLGVDMDLVKESHKIKTDLAELEKTRKTISNSKHLVDNSNLGDIRDEIISLTEKLKNFQIAENFDKLKENADSLTEELNNYRNKIYFLKKELNRKQKNLKLTGLTEIDNENIERVFNEANFFFNDKIVKRLDEAQEFHKTLIKNRRKRLSKEIETITSKLSRLEKENNQIGKKRDSLVEKLSTLGALEERDSIKDRIVLLEKEKKDLEKYDNILSEIRSKASDLELDNASNKRASVNYLEDSKEKFQKIESNFRTLVKAFYENKGGSLTIQETKKAKYLFDIDIEIPKDGSQGVGEVKIFCYDTLLMYLNREKLGFLAHDGCIFSEMDPRQKANIFRVVLKLLESMNFQYYINIGDNSLKEVLDSDVLSVEQKEQIKSSIRLELTDQGADEWLFGQTFN